METGPDVGTILLWGVAILIIVEVFVIGHAVVGSRKELEVHTRLLTALLAASTGGSGLVGAEGRAWGDGGPSYLYIDGVRWPAKFENGLPATGMVRVKSLSGTALVVEPIKGKS